MLVGNHPQMEHDMTKPVQSELKRLLPELFPGNHNTAQTKGMCNPETGCAPDDEHPDKDILSLLKKAAKHGRKD